MELIKSDDLKKNIAGIFHIDAEKIGDEHLEKVESLTLKRKLFNGTETDYDFTELHILSNLKICNFMDFKINQYDLESLNNLEKLSFIYFDFCEFELEYFRFDTHVETLIFNVCKGLKLNQLKDSNVKTIRIVGSSLKKTEYDISDFESLPLVEKLHLNNCNIKNIADILKIAPNIKYLNLDGSIVENAEELDGLNIIIDNEEEYHLADA